MCHKGKKLIRASFLEVALQKDVGTTCQISSLRRRVPCSVPRVSWVPCTHWVLTAKIKPPDEEAINEEATSEEATDEEATDEDCHILPLTGLNAFVYTGLNAQNL